MQTAMDFFRQNPDLLPPRTSAASANQPEPDMPAITAEAEEEAMAEEELEEPMDVETEPQPEVAPDTAKASRKAARLAAIQRQYKLDKENHASQMTASGFRVPRAFIDPQAAAQPVDWSSQLEPSVPRSSAPASRPAKRPAPFVEDGREDGLHISDDEGFDEDDRPNIDPDARRRAAAATASRNRASGQLTPKRARIEPQPTSGPNWPAPAPDTQCPDPSAHGPTASPHRPTQERARSTSQPAPPSSYAMVRQNARAQIRVVRTQSRRPWTESEEEALLSYIEEMGCAWAEIKREDNRIGQKLLNRDQVALKDKARNMRFDYHKAGVMLPTNFENVTMSRTQLEKLRDMGKEVEINVQRRTRRPRDGDDEE
jgi:Myb-like DNA-binding domain